MQPDTNWRQLPAGEELDALIAERVLGWRWVQSNRSHRPDWQWVRPDGSCDPHVLHHDPSTYGWPQHLNPDSVPPRSSLTWEGAGLVVEAMEARGWRLDLLRRPVWDWEAVLWPRVGLLEVEHADTAPLAICRAALAAMETEEEK